MNTEVVTYGDLCVMFCSNDAFGAAWTANFDSAAVTTTTASTATYDRLATEPSLTKPAAGSNTSTGIDAISSVLSLLHHFSI